MLKYNVMTAKNAASRKIGGLTSKLRNPFFIAILFKWNPYRRKNKISSDIAS